MEESFWGMRRSAGMIGLVQASSSAHDCFVIEMLLLSIVWSVVADLCKFIMSEGSSVQTKSLNGLEALG